MIKDISLFNWGKSIVGYCTNKRYFSAYSKKSNLRYIYSSGKFPNGEENLFIYEFL